ncbi:hypothetical protein R6Q57_010669 [Mikania cordata]
MNDYEKNRLMRVQENHKRLKDLGVKRIANSLTSLGESKKIKKKIVKPTPTNAADVEYIPHMGDDIEEDYQEFASSVEVSKSKKQHHPKYIAPQSMNKLAKFVKRHRVTAPNTSYKLSLDSNATKENQFKARITMGELISSTRGTHKPNEVSKQVVANPNCMTRKRVNRRLVLIDEDDEEDDDRFQNDLDQDDEFENMDKMTFENTDDDQQEDNIHDDLENEDDALVEEQLQGPEIEKTKGCEKYDVLDAAKTWVLMTIGNAYKVHKCRFKKKHFYQYKDNKSRWRNRPKSIPEDDLSRLLSLWNNKTVAKNEDPNKEVPTLTQVFEHTRKRTEGRSYLHTYDNTSRKIEQMRNYKPSENESASVDPFIVVMNKEQHGYRRLYGRRVTNKLIKKLDGGDTSHMITGGLMESIKASVEVEKNQLLEQRKEIEEDLERKKVELEAMQKDINNQRENFEAMMRKLMEQLPFECREFLT